MQAGNIRVFLIKVSPAKCPYACEVANVPRQPLAVPSTPRFVLGTLSALDPDGPAGLTFILTNNASGKFQLVNGNQIAVANPELIAMDPQASYQIGVLVLDPQGGVFEQSFTINVVQAV